MTGSQEPDEADVRDWLLAILLAAPLLLAVFANLFTYDYRVNFRNYHLTVHYTLYLVGLALAIFRFIQERMKRSTSGLAGWFCRIFVFMVIWDVAAPFQLVASFSLLKALFYLLILAQLSQFVVVGRRFIRYSNDPYPFTLLLALTTVLFFQESISALSFSGLKSTDFFQALFSIRFLGVGIFVAMVLLTVLHVLRSPWLIKQRVLLEVIAGFGACLLAANALVHTGSLSALSPVIPNLSVPSSLGVALPFSTRTICLYLYLFVLAIHDTGLKLAVTGTRSAFDFAKVVPMLFAATFFLLYFQMNSNEIARAIQEVSELREPLLFWGGVLLLGLLALADGLGLLGARHVTPESQPKPSK